MRTRSLTLGRGFQAEIAAAAAGSPSPPVIVTDGPLPPGLVASVDIGNGGGVWENPTNAEVSDDMYASYTSNGGDSEGLQASQFGFAVPAGATILGITVNIERKRGAAGDDTRDASVRLLKAGVLAGEDRAVPADLWPLDDTVRVYGGVDDLWGTTWSAAEVNAAGFGVSLSANDDSGGPTALVDFISLAVTYQ